MIRTRRAGSALNPQALNVVAGFVGRGDGRSLDFEQAVSRLSHDRHNARIVSFSQARPDGDPLFLDARESPGYARPTMWAHYARGNGEAGYGGACFVFDREEVLAALDADGRSRGGAVRHGAVVYADRPVGTPFLFSDSTESADDQAAEQLAPLFLTKTNDWAVEHEYRAWYVPALDADEHRDERGVAYLDFGTSLRAIVLGPLFPDQAVPAIRTALEHRRGVELHRINWDNDGHRLNEVR